MARGTRLRDDFSARGLKPQTTEWRSAGLRHPPPGNQMTPIRLTVGALATADDDGICASQTPSGAGNLTIAGALASGGSVTLDKPRRILVTTGSDESAKTLTIYGTNWYGQSITETMTGPNATTGYTTYDFATVTRVAVSAAFTGAVKVGTNGIASSPPIFLDPYGLGPTSIQVVVSGTVNYTIQQSLDDPNSVGYTSTTWVSHPDTAVAAATASAQSNYAYAPRVARLLLNSGTGSATLTIIQSGSIDR